MKVLVLAGGADQIALINELHRRNYEVILADYYPNPPAAQFADKHIQVSTLDVEAIRNIAKEENVELITTACTDQALLTVAKVSEDLNMPCYIPYQTALNVTNKQFMKRVMKDNNIPSANYFITDGNEICDKALKYPLVVKPVDCNSSKGVVKIFDRTELKSAIEQAVTLSRTNTAIVEEYKEGLELSVDIYVKEDGIELLSVTGTYKMKNKTTFTITQSYYPVIAADKEKKIIEIAFNISKAFNLKNTPLLIQMIMDEEGDLYVLEFSARMGGGSKYYLIDRIAGVDIMKIYVDLILGLTPEVSPIRKINYALMNYVYCEPGIFSSLKNCDALKESGIIDDWFQYKAYGTEITKSENSGDRPLGFFITAQTKEELSNKLSTVDRSLQVIDDKGRDIMLHGIYSIL